MSLEAFVSESVQAHLHKAANQLACELAAAVHEGEVPNRYHEYVEDAAFEGMVEALGTAEVEDLDEWRADQDLDERVERNLARAETERAWT